MELDRDTLQKIRQVAEDARDCPGLVSCWRRAYEELADAADRLDAMLARTTLCVDLALDEDNDVGEIGRE